MGGWRFSTLVVVISIPLLFADAASGAQESGEARLRITVGALLAAGFLLRAHYVRDTFVSGSRPNPAEDDIARAFVAEFISGSAPSGDAYLENGAMRQRSRASK